MAKKYKITNYGNTRTVYIKGQSWEITKHQTIEIDDEEVPHAKEVADAFERLPFVDVEVIEQPDVKPPKKVSKKKVKKAPTRRRKIERKEKVKPKKKVTAKTHKKIKRRKVKRRKK